MITFKAIFPLFLLLSSCVSVQQMHSATVLEKDEVETMVSVSVLDSSFFNYSDYPEHKLTTVVQISQRKGLGDYQEMGLYAYLPMIDEAKYGVAPNFLGGDFKKQIVDKENFDLAIDFGVTFYSIVTFIPMDYGIIASSNNLYSSVFVHLHGDENLNFTTTFGYQGEHIVYEARIPFIADQSGEYSAIYPILSFGLKK